jgi:hypothetical protein
MAKSHRNSTVTFPPIHIFTFLQAGPSMPHHRTQDSDFILFGEHYLSEFGFSVFRLTLAGFDISDF